MYRIPLRVIGVDLADDDTLERIGAQLSDLTWMGVDDRVLAVVNVEEGCEPVGAAIQAARRILHALAGSVVNEVDPDLVNVSDIAHRVGVSREAVRLWVEGKRGPGAFPPSVGSPGGSKVWPWAVVNEWLRSSYGLDDDVRDLNPLQTAQLNSALLRVQDTIDSVWEFMSSFHTRLTHGEQDTATAGAIAHTGKVGSEVSA